MGLSHQLARLRALREVDRRRNFYKKNLFELCRDILGYDRLTEEFHRPLCETMDARRLLYNAGKYDLDQVDLWPRGTYKTTLAIGQGIQDWLWDPKITRTWFHAVQRKAELASQEMGHQLQCNKELREILPEEARPFPLSRNKKWNKAEGFRLPCNEGKKDPSMYATGQGSEGTGGHSDVIDADDVIGENTIQDSLMPKVRTWLGTTVAPILNPGGRKRFRGTHWDEDDIYTDMRKSPDCDVTVRACYETDGEPDPKGKAIMFREGWTEARCRKWFERQRRTPGMTSYNFSCQYLNDPLPAEARLWERGTEKYCTRSDALSGNGVMVVISDPAPKGLSLRDEKSKWRGIGEGDWWSIAVIRHRIRGQKIDMILMDGVHSQNWSLRQGHREAARLMLRWDTPYLFEEFASTDYTENFLEAAEPMGADPWLEDHGGRMRLPRFQHHYGANSKNIRVEGVCDKAKRREFWISSSCPKDFVDGDGDKVGFLPQMCSFRPLPKGRNVLKWDDDCDVVARGLDPAILELVPMFDDAIVSPRDVLWMQSDDAPGSMSGSRCRHIYLP